VTDEESGTPPKSSVEQAVEHAVEVFVYAPIGLLFEGASLLPQLIEKGKSQVTMARMIGKFAVTQGSSEAEKMAAKLQDQAIDILGRIGGSTAPPAPIVPNGPSAGPVPSTHAPSTHGPSTDGHLVDEADPVDEADHAAGSDIEAETLSIPDYDGLSASHVVNRLAGLLPPELEAVRLYEMANRGRKTILSKIAQLQAG
jgi:hypothetical protein